MAVVVAVLAALEGVSEVAESDFQPYRRSIEELLTGSDYYVIPRFQRPYSWDRGNLDEFWRDVIEDNPIGYFIGPMVGWRRSTSPDLHIVDGQQRLTTVVLALAVLRNMFATQGQTRLAAGIHRYIEKPDRDNDLRFVLQGEVRSPYVNNAILAQDRDVRIEPSTQEEHNIRTAFQSLNDRVTAEIETAPEGKVTQRLKDLRDRLLGLRVIWIEHGNEDDAYVVFETLNSRGKDLEVVDLLKNHLLNLLRRGGNRTADAYRDQWTRFRLAIDESQAKIDVNRYVLHWWLSQEPYIAQRKLFREIRKKVRTKDHAAARLESLEADAPWYRSIYDPGSANWGQEERMIPRSLEGLSVFGVVQPAPLLLSLLRARRERTVNLPQLIRTFQAIERFHFQFTTIAQQSSSGGISEMYAKYARELTNADDGNARAGVLAACRAALAARTPEHEVFASGFADRLVLTDEVTREKKLVQYVLRRMLEASHPGTRVDAGSVEHILPQDQIPSHSPEVVGSIGNLLWIPEKLNTKLANKSFEAKKVILSEARDLYDVEDILAADQWGPDEIEARTKRLAKVAREDVWRLAPS